MQNTTTLSNEFPPVEPQPVAQKKKRLEWIDAMRGFTMILVVAYHVAQSSFGESFKTSSSMPFLVIFRMPLFFFISGFLAYKASLVWDFRTFVSMSGKKLRVQLVPTVVFATLAAGILSPKPFLDAMEYTYHSLYKGGYWFTLVLLYMLLVYYVFAYLESKLPRKSWIPVTLLFVTSLCVYESCYLPKYFSWAWGSKSPRPVWLVDTSLFQLMEYFPFFVFGNIVHRYWSQAQKIMDSKWFYPILVAVVIFFTMDYLKWHNLKFEWRNFSSTMAKFLLLTMVFMYFRHYEKYFTQFTLIGKCLQYIGRRTLDIYMLHYFFLPNLPHIGEFFDQHRRNFAIDTTASIVVALLVIAFSIITSNILRVSPFLKKYLFGR